MPSPRSAFTLFILLLMAGCQAPPAPTITPLGPTGMPPANSATPTTSATPAETPNGPWIRLTPNTGAPGTPIQIQGYLPGGPTAGDAEGNPTLQHTTICWDGCLTGFTAVDVPVQWSADQAGKFSISFNAPDVPWLEPQGPHPVQDGDYAVGVQCLGPLVPGCAAREALATASFHLAGAQPSRCIQAQPCAELVLSPSHAQPGDSVAITGWAPLIETIDGQPTGYTLAIEVGGEASTGPIGQVTQQPDGELGGAFTVPQSLPGSGTISPGTYDVLLQAFVPQMIVVGQSPPTIARASLALGPSLAWGELGVGAPVWLATTADLVSPSIAVDPGNPGRLAYCAPNAVRLSNDSGQTWHNASIAGAVDAIDQTGFEVMSGGATGGAPQCLSVALDAAHPVSLYAVFATAERQMGAPPEFFKGLITADGGSTWHLVPAPGPAYDFPFGGFASWPGGRVEARFSTAGDVASAAQAEVTRDGGMSWSLESLGCPGAGPCLRWGPAPSSISGMGAPRPQSLLRSTDAGQSWSVSDITLDLHASAAGQAAGFDSERALVVAGLEAFPARWTSDGGLTWTPLALPTLPGQSGAAGSFPALQILPNGTLFALADDGTWKALLPGASMWCSTAPALLPKAAVRFVPAADEVWWLNPETGMPGHTSLSGLVCSP